MTITKINASSSIDVTPAMRNYLDESVKKIANQLPKDASFCWSIKYIGKERHLKLSIVSSQFVVRCEERNRDFYDSVDTLIDRATAMARKYSKAKIDKKRRKLDIDKDTKSKDLENYAPAYLEKSISPIAMSLESALREKHKKNCSVFLYLDKETLQPCALTENPTGDLEVLHILTPLGV